MEQDTGHGFSFTAREKAQWASLFKLAEDVVRLSPWSWCRGDTCFGIRPKGEREPYFAVFFGGVPSEAHIVRYVKGWRALYDFVSNVQSPSKASPSWMLEIPMLEFSLLPEPMIFPFERKFHSALGLWPVDMSACMPVFRSVQPGFHPWFPLGKELDTLKTLVYQTYGMMLRLEDPASPFRNQTPGKVWVLSQGQDGKWSESFVPTRPFTDDGVEVRLKAQSLEKLKAMPLIPMTMQISLQFLPIFSHFIPVAPDGAPIPFKRFAECRPLVNYLLIAANAKNGEVACAEMLHADQGVAAMWGKVPEMVFSLFDRLGGCPGTIEVMGDRLGNLFHSLEVYLPFKLVLRERLERLDAVIQHLQRRLMEQAERAGNRGKDETK